MRITRLFTDQPISSGKQVVLEGNVAQHLGRVLRAKVGDVVALFNGNGEEYVATVTEISKRAVCVVVGEAATPATESRVHTLLGLCLSKGDRFDWAIQKASELGVGAIAPLYSERVDFSIPPDRVEKRVAHWQQIAISACEQCGRVKVPSVAHPQSLLQWVQDAIAEQKWVLHCSGGDTLPLQVSGHAIPRSAALLIGPEGGLTDEEVAVAKDNGFGRVRMGPRVLRTETAPIVALSALSVLWGEIPG